MKIKNDVFVYAEGGGSGAGSAALQAELRRAFAEFFAKTRLGMTSRPRVVTCGGREQAFDMFCTARSLGKNAMLLVDSETPVIAANQPPPADHFEPWAHLKGQANWTQPQQATNDDCHLMVQCMENWFLADWSSVSKFFGAGFKAQVLPTGAVETITKNIVYQTLEQATANCKSKGRYGKGSHSFKLLGLIDPSKVMSASPWAKRFIDELAKRKP